MKMVSCIQSFWTCVLPSGSMAGTAERIYNAMDCALSSRNIPWQQCIGLGMDNTSVNMG